MISTAPTRAALLRGSSASRARSIPSQDGGRFSAPMPSSAAPSRRRRRTMPRRRGSSRLSPELPRHHRFAPVIRAVQAAHPDLVFVASYRPTASASCARSARSGSMPRWSAADDAFSPRRSSCSSGRFSTASSIITLHPGPLRFSGHQGVPREIPGEGAGRGVDPLGSPSRRSPMRPASAGRAVEGATRSTRTSSRNTCTRTAPHHRRRHRLQRGRRMAEAAPALHPVPEHQPNDVDSSATARRARSMARASPRASSLSLQRAANSAGLRRFARNDRFSLPLRGA